MPTNIIRNIARGVHINFISLLFCLPFYFFIFVVTGVATSAVSGKNSDYNHLILNVLTLSRLFSAAGVHNVSL